MLDGSDSLPNPDEMAQHDELVRRELDHANELDTTPAVPILPQIRQSEGAMAHEEHGYSMGTGASDSEPSEISDPASTEVNPRKEDVGNTDPETRQWRKENWEHNKDKAEVMAYAEDSDRTDAAKSRKAANLLEAYPIKLQEVDSQLEEMGPEPRQHLFPKSARLESKEAARRYKQRREDVLSEGVEHSKATQKALVDIGFRGERAVDNLVQARRANTDQYYRREHLEEVRKLRHRAMTDDQIAREKGELAGVSHSVSDAYKEAHPEYNFSPEGIIQLRNHIKAKRAEINEAELYADNFNRPGTVFGLEALRDGLEEELEGLANLTSEEIDLLSEPDSAGYDEWINGLELDPNFVRLLINPDTKLDDIRKYLQVATREDVDELRAELDEMVQVLQDLRDGRASDLNYQKLTEEDHPKGNEMPEGGGRT